ncbi:hypothetical protein [Streptomyces sp. URMC 125]|uniref:hypothetical protein n=1 Tax=Streptomyces sp. URMC 125 TaxID=3423419 RepID=UPI003F1CD9DD
MEEILDHLVPQLVGRRRDGEVCGFGRPDGAHPVLEVVGGRNTGKTALLDALYVAYKPWVPLARVDCADPRLGEPSLVAGVDELETSNVSPLTSLLYLLSYKLGLDVERSRRRVRFRRLSAGLVVVSAWRPEEEGLAPEELRLAQSEVEAVLASDQASQRRRRAALDRWLDVVGRLVGGLVPVFPQADALGPLFDLAREQLRARPDRGALRWWGEQLRSFQGDPLQRLFASVWDFRRGGVRRREAEARLVAAFLEDVCDHYGLRQRLDRAARPLLLLDNVHTLPGRRFMEPLTARLAASPPSRGRPVVVATALGRGTDHAAPVREVAGLPPDRPLVRLGIPALTDPQIRELLNTMPDYPSDLPLLIRRFSGGRPGSVRVLVEKSAELRRSGGRVDGPTLLGAAAPELLARLLPAAEPRERLTLLSAAQDEAAAVRLWRGLHPDDDAPARVEQARAYLRAQYLDGDHATQILLRHRLAGDLRWERIHLLLRAAHNPHQREEFAGDHDDRYLFHTLALGRLEVVAHALHHRFTAVPAGEWLAALNTVCAAPHPPASLVPPRQEPPCGACTGPAGFDEVHWAVRRLVRAVWDLSDPCHCLPDPDELEAVRTELSTLHRVRREDDTAFRRAARLWCEQLQEHRQAPYLGLTEGTAP